MWRIHGRSFAFACTSVAATMMHSVFMFYYVKVYLNRFNVSEAWFHFAQVMFMVWNAVNDPLFGYIQDNYNFSMLKSRRLSILYGAPLFVISFIVPWFPWGDFDTYPWLSGFQLMVSLCFYDAMFTFVLLAQCALFAEMSTAADDRIRLIRYQQIGSLFGHSSVFFTGLISSNLESYHAFQMCTIVIGVLALGFMIYSGRNTRSQYDNIRSTERESLADKEESASHPCEKTNSQQYTMIQQIYQVMSQRNFLCFVFMNFCQVYHATFLGNFATVFCDVLISSDEMSSVARSFFYGSFSLTAQLIVILFTPVVRGVGYYRLVRISFLIKIAMGTWVYFFGQLWWGLALFFFLDSVCTYATFSLFNLPLSDIIDVDKDKHKRKQPLSSMVFGTNALITKPAQSVAPMLTVAILNRYGYESIRAAAKSGATLSLVPLELKSAMIMVCSGTSIIMGCLQYWIWSGFTIRNSHNTIAKHVET